jgi:hypothetical protein
MKWLNNKVLDELTTTAVPNLTVANAPWKATALMTGQHLAHPL